MPRRTISKMPRGAKKTGTGGLFGCLKVTAQVAGDVAVIAHQGAQVLEEGIALYESLDVNQDGKVDSEDFDILRKRFVQYYKIKFQYQSMISSVQTMSESFRGGFTELTDVAGEGRLDTKDQHEIINILGLSQQAFHMMIDLPVFERLIEPQEKQLILSDLADVFRLVGEKINFYYRKAEATHASLARWQSKGYEINLTANITSDAPKDCPPELVEVIRQTQLNKARETLLRQMKYTINQNVLAFMASLKTIQLDYDKSFAETQQVLLFSPKNNQAIVTAVGATQKLMESMLQLPIMQTPKGHNAFGEPIPILSNRTQLTFRETCNDLARIERLISHQQAHVTQAEDQLNTWNQQSTQESFFDVKKFIGNAERLATAQVQQAAQLRTQLQYPTPVTTAVQIDRTPSTGDDETKQSDELSALSQTHGVDSSALSRPSMVTQFSNFSTSGTSLSSMVSLLSSSSSEPTSSKNPVKSLSLTPKPDDL